MRILENRIPPPVVALLMGAAMWSLAPYTPMLTLAPMPRDLVAALVAMLGIGMALAGAAAFRKAATTTNPLHPERATALVAGGIFRFTRNPMYVGLSLVLLAWAIHLASPLAVLGPLLFCAYITRFQVLPEERAMEARFGDSYRQYKQRVRRWL